MTLKSKILARVAIQYRVKAIRKNWLNAKKNGFDSRAYWRDQYIDNRRAYEDILSL